MANFKTHISWGVLVGIVFVVASLIYSIFSGIESIFWVFAAVIVGSFLPDLDSDDGLPFQILFGLLGAGAAAAVFLNLQQGREQDLKLLIILPILAFIAVRFGAGSLFKKFTHHRGMFHSIPAAASCGLAMVWLLEFFSMAQERRLFIGLAAAVGYLGHLILDEIYSTVNFQGMIFKPKKSLGSALKLWSSSSVATLLVYIAITVLMMALPEVWELTKI